METLTPPPPHAPALDMAAVGARIRQARQQAGLTQQAAARLAGLNPGNYNLIEMGRARGLRVETLARLCDLFGTSADTLLGRQDAPLP